jgi:predicted lipoprotein with Yx(FWY)xxD motif
MRHWSSLKQGLHDKIRIHMNPSGTNKNHRHGNDSTPQKAPYGISKRSIFFIGLALIVTVLVIFVSIANSRINRSSTDSTNVGSTNNNPPPGKTAEPSPTTPLPTGTVITTGDSAFGTMLFNEKKQAIYIWEREVSEKPECYGNCAEAWPPVLTDGEPQATRGVDSSLLGTTTRTDGSLQVTYNGHPLYYYAHEGPGEVECHNISTHGGLWWVIQPNGNRAD